MKSWASEDKKILLYFEDSVIIAFTDHIQFSDTQSEAGGILLGSLHASNLLISTATKPSNRDKRSRFLFDRLPDVHRLVALSLWIKSKGTLRYLGEWHTHPEDYPTPSNLDKVEWKRISASRKDKRPLLAVIVGRKALHVELIHADGANIIMHPIE
ncbi:MAG: Mov34/MPN/PAD-1 family protein [Methylophilus sp.]|uniref:Mov34/MPN/PAD-1 family protein n=1 Tax=Methylophilus sp. TaxID=29541 RepID=UPI003F9F5A64